MLFCEKSLRLGTTNIPFPVVAIQVEKKPKESWNEHYERLQDWIRKARLPTTDDWYLAHFRTHILFGDDPFKNQMVNPQKWVDVMDNLEALYDRVKMEREIFQRKLRIMMKERLMLSRENTTRILKEEQRG